MALHKQFPCYLQILGLHPGELEWLSNHLGHSINVQQELYRLHEDTIEVAKISKVLMAMEDGTINQHKGKSLEQMSLAGRSIIYIGNNFRCK